MSDIEKKSVPTGVDVSHKSDASNRSSSPEAGLPADHTAPALVCPAHTSDWRLTLKVDFYIVPFLIVLYLLAFLDRVNIGNARAFGLETDLNLTGVQYNTALTIFFIPYVIFEIPSNILMKKLSPRIWLSICCLGFGIVSICQGLVQNYAGLLATRFLLGLFECGMFPGCFYLLSMWYRRDEAQKRYSLFFSSTSLAGAFGGLLAYGIGQMDYVRGYRGWRWIFILEGVITALAAIVFWFSFPAFPEQASFLKEDERAYLMAKLAADQGHNAAERPITFKDALNVMKDHRIWLGGFMYFGMIVPAYSYAYFAPTIISTYTTDPVQIQLRSVFPWIAAFCFAMAVAIVSDWIKHRFAFTIFGILMAVSGFAVLLNIHNDSNVQYGALFLIAMGCYSAMPIIVCWFNMNLGGHHRRAIGTAWQIGFGNIGGILATYSFLKDDAPKYTKGYAICVSFMCFTAVMCMIYAISIFLSNKKRSQMADDVSLTDDEKAELGDLNPSFRYMM